MTNLIPCRGWNWRICLGQANGTLALVVMLIAQVIVATPSAQAQTYKVLYSFTGGADGAFPFGALVGDHAGNLYGTTPYGGASGYGTVFKLDTTGKETVLYSFTGGGGRGTSQSRSGPRPGGQPLRHHPLRRRFLERDGVQAGYDG
jgi:uncharacterized repeat protein (TIGR03803 family)